MPLAKIKFVVSSSDSETGYEPENLLGKGKGGRTKWRGKAGASNNIVVFQLEKESRITSVDIGNEFSALIGVLVSKSCDSKQNFQALIPSTSFMDVYESRSATNGNRMKMFGENKLYAVTAKKKWDMVKIVCSQPFNSTKPYGISFIAITVEDDELAETTVKPENVQNPAIYIPSIPVITRMKAICDSFKAGNMFKHKEDYKDVQIPSVSGTKKEKRNDSSNGRKETKLEKDKLELDDLPEAKRLKLIANKENKPDSPPNTSVQHIPKQYSLTTTADAERKGKNPTVERSEEPVTEEKPLNEILRGVRFALSGYQNPERSILRNKAKEMGAVYESDWCSGCTHLVCAFRNTPKYRQVGKTGIIVTEKWIDMCYSQKKRLPESDFAL